MTWRLEFEAPAPGKQNDLTDWKRNIAAAAQEALLVSGLTACDVPLSIDAEYYIDRPRSAKRTARHVTNPGSFALTLVVRDGLRGIIYPGKREGHIVRCDVSKEYTDGPGYVRIIIEESV